MADNNMMSKPLDGAGLAVVNSVLNERLGRIALGLTLFVGCDLCVGLFNARLSGSLPLHLLVYLGMWFFYLPSQVLIALSALPEKEAL